MDNKIQKDIKKCCVCGRDATQFSPSLNTGNNLYYCDNCMVQYLENYNEMVNMGFYSNELCNSYKQKTLIPSLSFYKKTIEQFDSDVKNFLKDDNDE